MTPLTIATCRARALACEECANHLDLNWTEDSTEVLAGHWLAERMREEATHWRERAHDLAAEADKEQMQPEQTHGQPPRHRKPLALTAPMAETLRELAKGAVVETESGFSWPRWQNKSSIRSSMSCPQKATLSGLATRGCIEVQRGRSWLVFINDAGKAAVQAHEIAAQQTHAPAFRSYVVSFNSSDHPMSDCAEEVTARTEAEARRKFAKARQRKSPSSECNILDVKANWR